MQLKQVQEPDKTETEKCDHFNLVLTAKGLKEKYFCPVCKKHIKVEIEVHPSQKKVG